MRPAFQGGKTAGIKTTPFMYPENFQSKELFLASVLPWGCPHSSMGKKSSLHSLLPGGGRFLLNQLVRSPTTTAFLTGHFFMVSLKKSTKIAIVTILRLLWISASWSSLWKLDFKVKGSPGSHGRPWESHPDSFLHHHILDYCLSRPVTSLQMKPWQWTGDWLSSWLSCSTHCLVAYTFALSHHSFCGLWGRTCHFMLELLSQALVQDEGC